MEPRLTLYDSVKHGQAALGDVTWRMWPSWRHRIRRVGGYWTGESDFLGTRDEMQEMFLEGMMREVQETLGSSLLWQGFAGEMELTLDGVTYRRSWTEIANRVKVIYTHIGDNQLTNGSAESGVWADINTPTTNEQSTDWVTDGTYSEHIVTDDVNDGAFIGSGIVIAAEKYYECRVSINVVSGTWVLDIAREDTWAILAQATVTATGQYTLRASVGESNTYAGNVSARIYCTSASGEIYADGAVFQDGAVRAETSWYEDTASQAEYGVMELAVLRAGMSDASANGLAYTTLTERAWPRTRMPEDLGTFASEEMMEDNLHITWFGYVFTTRNVYTTVTGTDDCDDHVQALIPLCEYITAVASSSREIAENTMQYQIDDRAPLRVWECLRNIALTGDANGNRWTLGVYENKELEYRQADTTLLGHYLKGIVKHTAGGILEPWLAMPGLYEIDDMPVGAAGASAIRADNPRVANVDEVTFDAKGWAEGKGGLILAREAIGDF